MSLIRCPECGREISDAAYLCPACGRPMREGSLRPGASATTLAQAASSGASFEYKSQRTFLGLPLVHVVYGPYWLTGLRPARGIVAFGNIAIGLVAFGGIAVGAVALGGISLGLIALGGIALGMGFGLGGIATGYAAIGGIAIGAYAIGGLGIGAHTLQNDPDLLRFFGRRFTDR